MMIDIGLMFWLGGMALSVVLCYKGWDKGFIYRYLPIIYGFFAGMTLSFLGKQWAVGFSSLEVIMACAVAGCVFWFAVWAERRNW
jgi:hypothetical protein